MIPGLENRLLEGSDKNIGHIAELVSAFYTVSNTFMTIMHVDPEGRIQCKG